MHDAVLFEEPPDLDRPGRCVAAVGVDEEAGVVTDGGAHGRHHRVRPSRPLVLVVAALPADPDLECREAGSLAELRQAPGLVVGPDVAAHARGVGVDRAHRMPEELAHALPLDPAPHVPQRRVDAGERPAHIRARELVLGVEDAGGESARVERVHAHHVRRDLAVQHLGRDVGVVGRDLAPALGAVVRPHPNERHPLVAEGLDPVDAHLR